MLENGPGAEAATMDGIALLERVSGRGIHVRDPTVEKLARPVGSYQCFS